MKYWIILSLIVASLALPQASHAAEPQCFEQTGFCIEGRFLEYWQQNGGLQVFGYPLSIAESAYNQDSGDFFLTQHFERARFELHPEFAAPYDVLLGRLGDDLLRYRNIDSEMLPRETGPKQGCLWFDATGHNVCNQANGVGFMTYWQNHGLNDPQLDPFGRSLQLFGYPLTEPAMETNANGDTVLTQHFERARFEWHPNQPNQFKVLLGLVGKESQQARGGESSWPYELVMVNDTLFFTAEDELHGRELWASDGTENGTHLVKDIEPGAGSGWPYQLAKAKNGLFFIRLTPQTNELWFSDGSENNTRIVKNGISSITNLTALGEGIMFLADDGVHGLEPWFSDGTETGTYLLRDINPGPAHANVETSYGFFWTEYTPMAGGMAFLARNEQTGVQVWWTDGSAAGTRQISNFAGDVHSVFELEPLDTNHLIVAASNEGTFGMWNVNISTGEQHVLATHPWITGSIRNPLPASQLTQVNGEVYYQVYTQGVGTSLWRTNGQPQQTKQQNLNGMTPYRLLRANNQLFVQLFNENQQAGWWIFNSDATLSQFMSLDLILEDTGNGLIGWQLIDKGARVYRSAANYQAMSYQGSLMSMSGTTFDATKRATNAKRSFFALLDQQHGSELWVSDAQGLRLVKDIRR
ncbi:ELWxxDGT repeat protein [Herpetosiphon llansteffanensis]|uniref:ELWxxDGT repeat protein n=1 Tax=Herpetosiphon llansteffanensis TaxID=2094568 RepID=UPI000D7BF93F|nr:ELWxxDGT repeat protein [Herpetosiphon llansteffanensis]